MTERLARLELAKILRAMDNLDHLPMNLDDFLALKLSKAILEGNILRKGYCPQREGTNIYLTENDRFYEN